jgi:hypothetical protein
MSVNESFGIDATSESLQARERYLKRFYPLFHRYEMENYEHIKRFSKQQEGGCDLDRLESRGIDENKHRKPAIVLGSGVSLERALPHLRDWKGALFAGVTHAYAVVAHSRKIDYLCIVDGSKMMPYYTKWDYWDSETELITHVHIHPWVLSQWKHRAYLYRQVFNGEEHFEKHLPMMYPLHIGIQFRGCVSNTMVQIANFMQYRPIYLVGVDFAWRDPNKTRVDKWQPPTPDDPTIKRESATDEAYGIKHGKELVVDEKTGFRWFSSENAFPLHLKKLIEVENIKRVYDCSDGRIDFLPKKDIIQVIKEQK